MKTKHEILKIAKAQLALDYNCHISDFEKKQNTINENKLIKGRRLYNSDGCFFKAVCFCGKVIISTSPQMISWCEEELLHTDSAWFTEFYKLRAIDNKLNEFGHEIADIHHYYLPNPKFTKVKQITNITWFEHQEIFQFENDGRFEEAFAFNNNFPDVLAVAAVEGNQIMAMAGASADCDDIWQIGIDVMPKYRGRGIGTNLVALLKQEILRRGKVPFYGTVESHIYSQNIAINAGFFPAWLELHSRKIR